MRVRFAVFLVLAVFISTGVLSPPLIHGQEATPQASAQEFPLSPDPADCTGEAVSASELLALWYGPDGSPVPVVASPPAGMTATEMTIPVGAPADEETTAAIISTVNEVFSCFAAGEFLRAYALFSENLRTVFGPEPGTPFEDAEQFLMATPEPESLDEPGQIVAITDVMMLIDGRVGAFVVEQSDGIYSTAYAVFVQEDGRWLVDDVREFSHTGEDEEDEEDADD